MPASPKFGLPGNRFPPQNARYPNGEELVSVLSKKHVICIVLFFLLVVPVVLRVERQYTDARVSPSTYGRDGVGTRRDAVDKARMDAFKNDGGGGGAGKAYDAGGSNGGSNGIGSNGRGSNGASSSVVPDPMASASRQSHGGFAAAAAAAKERAGRLNGEFLTDLWKHDDDEEEEKPLDWDEDQDEDAGDGGVGGGGVGVGGSQAAGIGEVGETDDDGVGLARTYERNAVLQHVRRR